MRKSKGRILYIEDDADTREVISMVFTVAGFEVLCTDDTDEAVHLARNQRFDLYMLDNWMPDVPGTQLSQRLRQFDTNTPILFYSAAAYESDKDAARLSGAQAYLVKPTSNDEIIAEVARLIAGSQHTTLAAY